MNPNTRTAIALGMSLVLWAPVAVSVVNGRQDVMIGGMYYLGGLLLAWVGTGIIATLVNGYRKNIDDLDRAKQEIEEIERRAERDRERQEERHNRRSSDPHND